MADTKLCTIGGCEKRLLARGWCAAHYDRWRKYGDPLGASTRPKRQPLQWLTEQLSFSGDECLPYPFGRTGTGYGAVYVEGGKQVMAHRWVCEQMRGPPRQGDWAAHSCANGHLGCVNPRHLRWATPKENGEDRVAHGNCPRGVTHPHAKLREDQALAIYTLKGTATSSEAGRKFGVTRDIVRGIWRGQTWAWLTGEPRYKPAMRT